MPVTGLQTRRLGATQSVGRAAEDEALRYLMAQGLELIDRNSRFRVGELDLIMGHGRTIVFVEVRFRRPSKFGSAAASVGRRKQLRLIRAAQCWLLQRQALGLPACRFDVVALDGLSLQWIQNAFQAA